MFVYGRFYTLPSYYAMNVLDLILFWCDDVAFILVEMPISNLFGVKSVHDLIENIWIHAIHLFIARCSEGASIRM